MRTLAAVVVSIMPIGLYSQVRQAPKTQARPRPAEERIVRSVEVQRAMGADGFAAVLSAAGVKVEVFSPALTLANVPLKQGSPRIEKVDVVFFRVKRILTSEEIALERRKRGLLEDIAAQIQANADDPSFSERHPNMDVWLKGSDWCSMRFGHDPAAYVLLECRPHDWPAKYFWYAGVLRRSAQKALTLPRQQSNAWIETADSIPAADREKPLVDCFALGLQPEAASEEMRRFLAFADNNIQINHHGLACFLGDRSKCLRPELHTGQK